MYLICSISWFYTALNPMENEIVEGGKVKKKKKETVFVKIKN